MTRITPRRVIDRQDRAEPYYDEWPKSPGTDLRRDDRRCGLRILIAFALFLLGAGAGAQDVAVVTPKLLDGQDLQTPFEQEALQRQFNALSAMQLHELEYSASGPIVSLHGTTGIVLPRSVRTLKKGDSAAEIFALLKDILLANGTEEVRVEAFKRDPYSLRLSHSIRSIPVRNGNIAIEYDPATLAVTGVAANFVPDRGLQRTPRLSAGQAEQIVADEINAREGTPGAAVEMQPGTHLAYYGGWSTYPAQRPDGSRSPRVESISARLVWVVVAVWQTGDEIRVVDAVTGNIVDGMSGRITT
jgi:hypothetical protein